MAEYHGHVHFEDRGFRYADSTDTSRSSDEPTGIGKSRTMSGFDWKLGEASTLEPTQEESNSRGNSATELLVKDGLRSVKIDGCGVTEDAVELTRLGDLRDEISRPDDSSSNLSSNTNEEPKKRRDFRDIFCGGITNLIDDIFSLIKGTKRDNDGDDVEYGPIRYVPHSLSTLTQTTKFTKEELKTMYRTFKNECPTGVVYEDTFKNIYSQFFPTGDSNMYAHYLFNAFDINHEGYICFEDFITSLSSLLRGKFEEKLEWVFKLYDINHDGFITREEMQDIVKSVYSLLDAPGESPATNYSYMEHANRVFRKLDQNNDGFVTYPEFVDACSRDPSVVASLKIFEDGD